MTLTILRPLAVGDYDAWALGAGSSKVAAVDPGDPVTHDDATSFITVAGPANSKISFTLTGKPALIGTVNALRVGVRSRGEEALTMSRYMRLNGTDGAPSTVAHAAAGAWTTHALAALARPGGGSWLPADIYNTTLQMVSEQIEDPVSANTDLTSFWVELDWDQSGEIIAQDLVAREIGSRRLLVHRQPKATIQISVPLEFLDAELLDDVQISHDRGPHPEGVGWGVEVWERRLARLLSQSVDFMKNTIELKLEDKRQNLVYFYNTFTNENSARGLFDGIAMLPGNVDIEFRRESFAWVEGPNGQVVQVNFNQPKYTPQGMLLERSRTNFLLHSAFTAGLSGWTQEGVGLNGAALNLDLDDLLFEVGVTTNSIEFVAGSPLGATNLGISQTTASISPVTYIVSVDHQDLDAAKPLHCQIIRNNDGKYLDSSGIFQVGATFITVPGSTSKVRWQSPAFAPGTGTVTVRVVAKTTAAQKNHLYHVQLENNSYATSRVVTSTATYTRLSDTASFPNDSTLRLLPRDQGTLWFRFTPLWEQTQVGDLHFFQCHASSGDYLRIYFRDGDNAVVGRFHIGGVDYEATLTDALASLFTIGSPTAIALRWTGVEGELELAPYTYSIFVDGVKGTDAVGPGLMTEPNPSDLLFTPGDTTIPDGMIQLFEISPFVLTDGEIAGLFAE